MEGIDELAQLVGLDEADAVRFFLMHELADERCRPARQDDVFNIVMAHAGPQGGQGAVDVFAGCRRKGQLFPLLRREVFQNAQRADVDVLLKQELVRFPAGQPYAAGRNIQQEDGLVGKVEFPLQHVIIQAEEFIVNFLGHAHDSDAEARAEINLIDDIEQVVGFADSRRRQDAHVRDVVVPQELLEFI